MKVRFSKRFVKLYDKAPIKVRGAFDIRLVIFHQDKFHPILNNHSLVGKYSGYRSINVTGDWRAIFRELHDDEIIYFDILGTHSKLYKKFN